MAQTPPCTLTDQALEARMDKWGSLHSAWLGSKRTATGATVRYRLDPWVASTRLELLEAEGRCCPTLSFEATVTVRVEAPESMRGWVASTFANTGVNGQQEVRYGGQQTSRLTDNRTPVWRTADLPVGGQTRGFTPLPARASVRRVEVPSVITTWAWWSNLSTAAVARPLGMIVSKPEGCRLEVTTTLRRS